MRTGFDAPKRIVALSLTASALLSVPSAVAAAPPRYPYPATAEQVASTQQNFETAKEYWAAHGVPAIKGLKLKIITGNGRFTCDGDTIGSGSVSEYCAAGAGTVAMTDAQLNGGATTLYEIFSVGHEVGHGVQDKIGHLGYGLGTELGATCLAGQMMRNRFEAITKAEFMVGVLSGKDMFNFADDPVHGTHEQEEAAFMQGFTAQNCAQFQ